VKRTDEQMEGFVATVDHEKFHDAMAYRAEMPARDHGFAAAPTVGGESAEEAGEMRGSAVARPSAVCPPASQTPS
jgi:hypothetical protein